jgi:hypothetical protein
MPLAVWQASVLRETFRLASFCWFATALGCVRIDVGRLQVVSTRPVAPADLERPASLTRRTSGRSCVWVALVAPVGPMPSLGDAVGQALDGANAAALWDAQVDYEITYVPPIGRGCYVVEGRAP